MGKKYQNGVLGRRGVLHALSEKLCLRSFIFLKGFIYAVLKFLTLISFYSKQKALCVESNPHRHHLDVEWSRSRREGGDKKAAALFNAAALCFA